jgi:hypothetical protein
LELTRAFFVRWDEWWHVVVFVDMFGTLYMPTRTRAWRPALQSHCSVIQR